MSLRFAISISVVDEPTTQYHHSDCEHCARHSMEMNQSECARDGVCLWESAHRFIRLSKFARSYYVLSLSCAAKRPLPRAFHYITILTFSIDFICAMRNRDQTSRCFIVYEDEWENGRPRDCVIRPTKATGENSCHSQNDQHRKNTTKRYFMKIKKIWNDWYLIEYVRCEYTMCAGLLPLHT